jgi:hypothetical protein
MNFNKDNLFIAASKNPVRCTNMPIGYHHRPDDVLTTDLRNMADCQEWKETYRMPNNTLTLYISAIDN